MLLECRAKRAEQAHCQADPDDARIIPVAQAKKTKIKERNAHREMRDRDSGQLATDGLGSGQELPQQPGGRKERDN